MKMVMFNWLHMRISLIHSSQRLVLVRVQCPGDEAIP